MTKKLNFEIFTEGSVIERFTTNRACVGTLLAHKQTHGGNKKKTRNHDFRGDFEKRRKLILGGALLTFARLSFQSFFREPKLGLRNGRI